MFTAGKPASSRILVVRLGAMGDIIHTLPAVASLKHSHPGAHLTWVVEPRWRPLLEENPSIDRIVELRRDSTGGLLETIRELRSVRYDFAVDFQGLIKSALTAAFARPERIFGYHQSQVRERIAALFYSNKVSARAAHVVDRHLELAAAAGATRLLRNFPLPNGTPEDGLPAGDYVLASPLAGWGAKQWPLEHYRVLGEMLRDQLGVALVLDGPPGSGFDHHSSLSGLIHATRRAAAVVGVDSGPLHLAAALGKPGVAIFGPTDPARNGPYGTSMQVLRSGAASTTYKRAADIAASMRAITPDQVFASLKAQLKVGSPVE
jgi:lipopolysaccharide heptosyltransferase I